MFEVVTAVAWDECEGIVMVTIVLVGACVCDTDPGTREKGNFLNNGLSGYITHSQNPKIWGKVKRIFFSLCLILCLKLRSKNGTHNLGLLLTWQKEQGC